MRSYLVPNDPSKKLHVCDTILKETLQSSVYIFSILT